MSGSRNSSIEDVRAFSPASEPSSTILLHYITLYSGDQGGELQREQKTNQYQYSTYYSLSTIRTELEELIVYRLSGQKPDSDFCVFLSDN